MLARELSDPSKYDFIAAVKENKLATAARYLYLHPLEVDAIYFNVDDLPDQLTALHLAAQLAYVDMVKLLLDTGADVNAAGGSVRVLSIIEIAVDTMRHHPALGFENMAAFHDYYSQPENIARDEQARHEIVSLLLHAGANIDNTRCLSRAAAANHISIMKLLIEAGLKENRLSQCLYEVCSRHDIFSEQCLQMVELLCQSGANIHYFYHTLSAFIKVLQLNFDSDNFTILYWYALMDKMGALQVDVKSLSLEAQYKAAITELALTPLNWEAMTDRMADRLKKVQAFIAAPKRAAMLGARNDYASLFHQSRCVFDIHQMIERFVTGHDIVDEEYQASKNNQSSMR